MFYRNVKIIRDSNTVYQKLVPSHEVEVLKHVFDPESVSVVKGWKFTDRPYTSPDDEYHRLRVAYGVDPMTGEYFVKTAYKTPAHLAAAIPRLAVWVTDALAWWSNLRNRKQERADLREQKFSQVPWKYEKDMRATSAGMLQAINEALELGKQHDEERERFRRD